MAEILGIQISKSPIDHFESMDTELVMLIVKFTHDGKIVGPKMRRKAWGADSA
jgi:hypothetical protein